MNEVAILGCGPAGLMAAHAVALAGGKPVIFSRKVKSELPGAQYLHKGIPLFNGPPDGMIRTQRRGTAEGYAKKVYGDPTQKTSWDEEVIETPAWNLRETYDDLWATYNIYIEDRWIKAFDLHDLGASYKLVISTIPPQTFCGNSVEGFQLWDPDTAHKFHWERMYVVDWAPPELLDNTVLYSGDPQQQWYRAAKVFGHVSTEATQWCFDPHNVQYMSLEREEQGEFLPMKRGIKVKGTDCDCNPQIKRAGRYGTWKKGYLTHHAFDDAVKLYEEAFHGSKVS